MVKVAKSKNKRGCFCGTFDESYLKEKQIPQDFCGICSICEEPGHLRHAPGCAPSTDVWCDMCFKRVWVRNNLQCVSLLATLPALLFGYWYFGAIMVIVFAVTTYANKKTTSQKSG